MSHSEEARLRNEYLSWKQQRAETEAGRWVWVNTATRVYHASGPLYGATKLGRFMTEEEAQKSGFRTARRTS